MNVIDINTLIEDNRRLKEELERVKEELDDLKASIELERQDRDEWRYEEPSYY